MNEYSGVMIFAEHRAGKIHPISFELLGKGREIADGLGCPLSAVLLGDRIREEAFELIYYGADTVFLFEHPSLREFDLLNYKHNIVQLLQENRPNIFLLGATHSGRSLGPRIAAALGTGLTADCIGLDMDDSGNLIQIRPAFTGNILAEIKTRTKPQMATVRYKVMTARTRDPLRKGEIIQKSVAIIPGLLNILHIDKGNQTSLAEARVIVSGGKGLKRASDFAMLADLAGLLHGLVGSSRPPVDDGWIGKEHQVGFSGNTVKPGIYFACGISGSPQHLAGMRSSDIIVTINTDPSAPIFQVSDYGVVGDIYEIIPKLIKMINKEYR